jgi:hypothetical protein
MELFRADVLAYFTNIRIFCDCDFSFSDHGKVENV